jgi:predicted kinase
LVGFIEKLLQINSRNTTNFKKKLSVFLKNNQLEKLFGIIYKERSSFAHSTINNKIENIFQFAKIEFLTSIVSELIKFDSVYNINSDSFYSGKHTSKLIILRGNSGSGKSTVAKKLREVSSRKIALIEQDYIRRTILKEFKPDDVFHIDLIFDTVEFALAHSYDVILEGILNFGRYDSLLTRLIELCPEYYIYYFDTSFEETLKRHATKLNAHEFGEKELREWYKPKDLSNFKREKIIPEEYSLEQTVKTIVEDAKL